MINADAFRSCPCVPSVLWLIAGIALPVLPVVAGFSWLFAFPLIAALIFAAVKITPANQRLVCFFLPVGLLLALLHLYVFPNAWIEERARTSRLVQIQAVIVDAAYTADHLSWLAGNRGYTARVTAVRSGPEEEWRRASGKVRVLYDRPENIEYGTRIHAAGYFDSPAPPLVEGEFDYSRFLQARSIQSVFHIHEEKERLEAEGWRKRLRALYRFREKLAERLSPREKSADSGSLLLAMTLGYREGIDPQVRRAFVRSGIVHIFAISGLHVGIIAAFILFAVKLCRLPYRWRFFLLPLILGVYVLMVGAGPAAVRAWIMISMWAVAKGFLIPLQPLNAVAAAAIIILLFRPLQIADTGFQFSFIIVTTLIVGWRGLEEALNSIREKELWIPSRLRSRGGKVFSQSIKYTGALFSGSVLAWLGAFGIILYTQGLFIPGAVVVNLLVAILAWLAIFLSILKLVLGFVLPWLPLAEFCGLLLERGMLFLQWLVDIAGEAPFSFVVARPGLAWIMIYYLLLLASITGVQGRLRGWKRWVPAVCAPLLLLSVSLVRQGGMEPAMAVFWGDGVDRPVFVVDTAGKLPPVVVNAGDYWTGRRVGSWLRSRGRPDIEAVLLPGTRWEQSAGLSSLIEESRPHTLVLPENWQQQRFLHEPVMTAHRHSGRIRLFNPPGQSEQTVMFHQPSLKARMQRLDNKEKIVLERITINGGMKVQYEFSDSAGTVIEFRDDTGAERQLRIPFSREPQWKEVKFRLD